MPAVVEAPDERAVDSMWPYAAGGGAYDGDSLPFLEDPEGPPSWWARWKYALRSGAIGVLAIGGAVLLVYGLIRYTRQSPRFAVRIIEMHGNGRRTPDEIMKRAGIAMGTNIFAVDLDAMRAAILDDPWIETAALGRRLPATLSIEVTEREAAALVAAGPDLYLATRRGELFKKLEPGDPSDLPVITGVRAEDLADARTGAVAEGRATRVSPVARALEVTSEFDRTSMAKSLPVQEVHIEDDGSIALSVGNDPIELKLGGGSYRKRLDQATRVLFELRSRGKAADVVFLDNEAHPERVVVRTR
jgi:cell division protein FtsQ